MTAPRANGNSLRLERLDSTRLFRALALSLVVHLVGWGGYSLNQKYHLVEKLGLSRLIQKLTPVALQKPVVPTPPPPDREVPLIFVNVNPETATPEPPKDAKYYSSLNAKAANPNPKEETQPELTGEQSVVPETETVPRNQFDRLQPNRPAQEPQEEEKPQAKQPVGDLAMAKPELNPTADPGTAKRERPRLLSQVKSTGQRSPSQQYKQKGGVRTQLDSPSLDTRSTITGDYDARFIDAVKNMWYQLLEDREYTSQGYVRLAFKLHHDGRISDLKVLENTVTETLSIICQRAVLSPAPYSRWTTEMRTAIGRDYREITFTFHYF